MASEVTPGLYRLPGVVGVGAFLWRPRDASEQELPLLFDCGCPWSGEGLAASLQALGCPAAEIRIIAITHDDIDHVGRLGPLQAISGAAVVAHELEAPRLAGERWRDPPLFHGPTAWLAGLLDTVYQHGFRHHPVQVTRRVIDGQEIGNGWIAVHTPGHTPGHASYFHPLRRILVAGDAIANRGGELRFPMGIYTEDPATAARSIQKLAALAPEIIVFGHGPALYNASAPLREFADSLAKSQSTAQPD